MDFRLNPADPLLMHIDLNSCFSTLEQQANPLLRGKPIVVAAYKRPYGCILSPSIEAKRYGIKVGMRVKDAQLLYPQLIVLTPDPPKYREAHSRFMKIFQSYSPSVTPKSIDEAVIDFTPMRDFYPQGLVSIAKEIKQRIYQDLGAWVSCSIGIAPNRWWAKLGASLHKPDGLDVVTYENIREVLHTVTLLDLCGINIRNKLRLNRYGIYTPVQFLDAPLQKLQKQVFQSIAGYYWYMRLRGFEVDTVDFDRKSYGQQYHLTKSTADEKELLGLLMKLCEKMGRRLRRAQLFATGIHIALAYRDQTYWHHGQTFTSEMLYTTYDLFQKARQIFQMQPQRKVVSRLAVSSFSLYPSSFFQDDLFDMKKSKRLQISKALDAIHDKYGEYLVYPGIMMHMEDKVLDRIAFGKSGITN